MTGAPRYRVNPACTFLMRAFAPGCPTLLTSWSHKRAGDGERVAIAYALPDAKARERANELIGSAASLIKVAIGRRTIAQAQAAIDGDTFLVDVLLVAGGVFSPGAPMRRAGGLQ